MTLLFYKTLVIGDRFYFLSDKKTIPYKVIDFPVNNQVPYNTSQPPYYTFNRMAHIEKQVVFLRHETELKSTV